MEQNGGGRPNRVVIAHKFPLVVEGLAAILAGAGFEVIDKCGCGRTAREAIRARSPDIAVLGLKLGDLGGLDLLRDRRLSGGRTILLCDDLDPRPLLAAVELSVDGLLLATAPAETAGTCVAAVAAGEQWLDPAATKVVLEHVANRSPEPVPALTRRERDVARLVAAGQRNRTIADALGISEGTVKMHLHNVYAKLGLESRTQLAMDVRSTGCGSA